MSEITVEQTIQGLRLAIDDGWAEDLAEITPYLERAIELLRSHAELVRYARRYRLLRLPVPNRSVNPFEVLRWDDRGPRAFCMDGLDAAIDAALPKDSP